MIDCARCEHEIHDGFCEEDDCGCDRDCFSDLLEYAEELEAELVELKKQGQCPNDA